MSDANHYRTTLHPGEIRANLIAVRAAASERLGKRELLRRIDDALGLLDQAVLDRGDVDTRAHRRAAPVGRRFVAGLVRRWRELVRPTPSLSHANARWEAVSLLVAIALAGLSVSAYAANVRRYDQLENVSDFLQGAEGLLTVVVIIAAWSYSTWHFERTRRIERVVEAIDRCRSLILIIDAHSLAKDFSRFWDPRRAHETERVDGLPREDTIEYLAIGARISKLTAQIAACYGTVVHDHAVIAAIDSVSQLALATERNALVKQELIARGVIATRGADSGA